ncbi:MAG: cytochrome c biogenesis CcdA family protein [Candidatus Woesearchaeota archaeon]
MSKRGLLLLLVFILSISLAAAVENDCLYYFYGEGCPHCGATSIYLKDLQQQYPELQIHNFEVYYNRTNLYDLQQYFEAYDVPLEKQGVPVIFYQQSYFVGDKPIMNYLENAILSNEAVSCPSLEKDETIGVIGENSPKLLIKTLTFLTVTGAAIVDSINPCAIAVLLIMLGALLSAADIRKRLLWTGLAFIFSIYVSYFLFGIGILAALRVTGLSYYFYKTIGVIAILIGLLNIKEYFWYGKVLLMEIPLKWRPRLKKMLSNVTSPAGAFIMGFAVSLFELPCTGGPYLVILGLLAEKTTRWAAMPILLYYNLIFVLPLIIITLVVYFSTKKIKHHQEHKVDATGEIERWRQKNIKLLHLIGGLIMFILGVMILFFF